MAPTKATEGCLASASSISAGVDVVAAADDQVLRPARDPQVAVRVHPAQVAGAQPFFVGIKVHVARGLEIGRARPNAGVGDADLADLVHRALLGHRARGVHVQDPHVGVGERQADRADLGRAVARVAGDEAGRLGHPVALEDLHPGGVLKPLEQRLGQRGRAAERILDRGNVRIHLALHQRAGGGGHHDHQGRLPALDQLPEVVEDAVAAIAGGRGHHHVRARHDAGHPDRIGREDVEHRQRAQQHVGRGDHHRRGAPAVVEHPHVGMLRHLGHAGGAAGVETGADLRLVARIRRRSARPSAWRSPCGNPAPAPCGRPRAWGGSAGRSSSAAARGSASGRPRRRPSRSGPAPRRPRPCRRCRISGTARASPAPWRRARAGGRPGSRRRAAGSAGRPCRRWRRRSE